MGWIRFVVVFAFYCDERYLTRSTFYVSTALFLYVYCRCFMDLEPTILYEDEYLLAIDKPAGLVVHGGVGTGFTFADWVVRTYPSLRDVGDSPLRPGMVHRLDKETSGVMLLAKDQEMFETLKRHFQKGKIRKEYHAFVYGSPKRSRGSVSLGIGKSRGDFRRQATRNTRGVVRDAYTEYVVAGACQDDTSLVRFYPRTGRTHQVRVHARSLNTPVVCDTRYAPSRDSLLGFSRLALHAYRVTLFTHRQTEPLHIVAPHPDDFLHALSFCSLSSSDFFGS